MEFKWAREIDQINGTKQHLTRLPSLEPLQRKHKPKWNAEEDQSEPRTTEDNKKKNYTGHRPVRILYTYMCVC